MKNKLIFIIVTFTLILTSCGSEEIVKPYREVTINYTSCNGSTGSIIETISGKLEIDTRGLAVPILRERDPNRYSDRNRDILLNVCDFKEVITNN